MKKKALIVGALGVAGKGLLDHLLRRDDWDVVALSRRPVDAEYNVSAISVDRLDVPQC
jgi:nucleoside-diphosphate-sugar epimerase